MKIENIVKPSFVGAYIAEAGSNRQNFINEAFFAPVKKVGLELSWLRGAKGAPISLAPTAFDAKTTFIDLPNVVGIKTEMPYFKQAYHFGEKDRQELHYVESVGDPRAKEFMARMYDNAANLADSAAVVRERMAMQLLFPTNGTPGISIKANGVDYTYNYDPSGTWSTTNYNAITTASKKWNVPATADPIADIQAKLDALSAISGEDITRIVMNGTTFAAMAACASVKNLVLTTGGVVASFATQVQVVNALRANFGVDVIVYNKQYKDESGVAHKFIPDGYVAFLPDGDLGQMCFGTTPAEIDLSGEDLAIVDTGVAIYREITKDPVNVNVIAAEIVLPSYERMDACGLIKVY